ncbi:MAG TPA: GlmU family protein [Bacteroidia bacterium]|nr:GlmU family protein [Bacteroidia bacterium]
MDIVNRVTTNTVLFDYNRDQLLPFTFTRPVADIRVGILTIREQWELLLKCPTSTNTKEYLSGKYPAWQETENLFVNGAVIPEEGLIEAARSLKLGQRLMYNDIPLAVFSEGWIDPVSTDAGFNDIQFKGKVLMIQNKWDLFALNDQVLRMQYKLVTEGRRSAQISSTNTVIGSGQLFVEPGAKIEGSTINCSTGPVYIGKDAEVMEGCLIRGPFALCDHAVLKMGAKIYGATTIGPHCRVGGEVNNSVLLGYSNKAHDGFLGNSVIGEWCNLGADTNNSNLKNNYSAVKVWNYTTEEFENSNLVFCGLFMGDHSKCSINTMFNTGTVCGVGANVFGSGFPPKLIPSFSWGGFSGNPRFEFEKVISLARQVYSRRNIEFGAIDETILRTVFLLTESTESAES